MSKNKLLPFFDFFFIKQAGDDMFICASSCQKLSLYSTILPSYCKNKKGAMFYASQCSYSVYTRILIK